MKLIAIACVALTTTAAVLAQSGDSKLVSEIAAAVDADHDAALALLERVVNINSGTMNLAGVRQVGDVFSAQLRTMGFTTRWVDGAPFNRAGHLVAERARQGPRVLLIGHLDTVFEADSPFQRFERLTPTTARGPGIIDMKGGDVIIVSALKALARVGVLDRLSVTIVMTGDEEDPGEPLELARKPLRDAASGAAVAMGFEDGAGDPRLAIVSRRGFTGWTLKVTGQPAHSSQIFTEKVGAGAIYEVSRVLKEMYDRLSTEALLSVNPGVLLAGTTVDLDAPHSKGTAFGKTNVVAGTAVAMGDIRAYTRDQLEKTKATMRSIAATPLAHTSAELTYDDSYPPMAPTDGNRRLLAMYDQASRDLGLGPVAPTDPRAAGAADVAFVADIVPQVIDGVGLMGRADHTPEETADLGTLASQTRRAALLLARLATQD